MINVTKTYLPPLEEYQAYLEKIWASGWVTNHGPHVLDLEAQLKSYLGVKYLRFVNNGTIALQLCLKSEQLNGEVITTPFSYVATTSSIKWEGCTPVFADIESGCLTLDPQKIEKLITSKTQAILATHVYGIPCDVEGIQKIADKHNLKVIYDAAHCFGTRYKGKSVLEYGDLSTLSFHATKLFHTVEGGAVVSRTAEKDHQISYLMNFGHQGPEAFQGVGINAKASELNAAMGLCLLPRVSNFIQKRKALSELYDSLLVNSKTKLIRPSIREGTDYNYSYYPIIFRSEEELLRVKTALNAKEIFPRRYFYPSLSSLPYVDHYSTPISNDISSRIMCLPLYVELANAEVEMIASIVLESL